MANFPDPRRVVHPDEILERGLEALQRHRARRLADLAIQRGDVDPAHAASAVEEILATGVPARDVMVRRRLLTPERAGELAAALEGHDFRRVSTAAPVGPPPDVLYVLADPQRNFHHFALVSETAKSEHGVVWKAWDCTAQKWVSLKVLGPSVPAGVRLDFRREGEALRTTTHKHLSKVHEAGEFKGQVYLSAELSNGRPLDLRDRLPSTLETLAGIGIALGILHAKGVLHRRLHPGCILREGDAFVVTDFGHPNLLPTDRSDRAKSDAARYLAPEVVGGRTEQIGPATDVYALGLMLWEALERRNAYEAPTTAELYRKILQKDPPTPTGPKALVELCVESIARNPAQRLASANEFADRIRQVLSKDSSLTRVRRVRRNPGRWIAAVAAILLVGGSVGGWFAWKARATRIESERRTSYANALATLDPAIAAYRESLGGRGEVAAAHAKAVAAIEVFARELERLELSADASALEALSAAWARAGDRVNGLTWLAKSGDRGARGSVLEAGLRMELAAAERVAREAAGRSDPGTRLGKALGYAGGPMSRIPPELAKADPVAAAWAGMLPILGGGASAEGGAAAMKLAESAGSADGAEQVWLAAAVLSPEPAEALARALSLRPGYGPARAFLAWEHLRKGRRAEAASDAEAAMAYRPPLPEARVVRAAVARLEGKPSAALADLLEVPGDREAGVSALLLRADVLVELGRADQALGAYASVLEFEPACFEARAGRARVRLSRGETGPAREELDEALKVNPKDAPILVLRARVRAAQQDIRGALEDLGAALASEPKRLEALVERGRLHHSRRDDQAAYDDLLKAVKLDPSGPETNYEFGSVLSALGDYGRAESHYTVALAGRPGWPEAQASRGIARFHLSRYSEAVDDLDAALSKAPAGWPLRPTIEKFREQAAIKSGR